TILYESEPVKLTLTKGEEKRTFSIVLDKKSVTLTGSTRCNNERINNITLSFNPDFNIENNTATTYTSAVSDDNGIYSVELSPGTYLIYAYGETEINGVNYIYEVSNETNSVTVTSQDIDTGLTYDIILTAKESED
ncbi:MAG: hypothetical protein ACOC5T_09835, partial [Elusimicrobiota bacterium]